MGEVSKDAEEVTVKNMKARNLKWRRYKSAPGRNHGEEEEGSRLVHKNAGGVCEQTVI